MPQQTETWEATIKKKKKKKKNMQILKWPHAKTDLTKRFKKTWIFSVQASN